MRESCGSIVREVKLQHRMQISRLLLCMWQTKVAVQRGPTVSVLCCSIHARYRAMAMPNWCQQAGPQPCASIDDIPRPILRDHLCEWHGVMHQNKQLGILPYRNIGAYVKWTRLWGLRSEVRMPKRQPCFRARTGTKCSKFWTISEKQARLLCTKFHELIHLHHPAVRIRSHVLPVIPTF